LLVARVQRQLKLEDRTTGLFTAIEFDMVKVEDKVYDAGFEPSSLHGIASKAPGQKL